MPATTKSGKKTDFTSRYPQIAGLQYFDRKPKDQRDLEMNFHCSHCLWVVMPGDKYLCREFAPGIFLLVHENCFNQKRFREKLDHFKSEINGKSISD